MKTELEGKLFEKYPKILRKDCLVNKSIDIGDGWYGLLDGLLTETQDACDDNPLIPQVIAHQVDEQFGGLRFYYHGGNQRIFDAVSAAEGRSNSICEYCGNSGKPAFLEGTPVRTLCDDCKDSKEKADPNE